MSTDTHEPRQTGQGNDMAQEPQPPQPRRRRHISPVTLVLILVVLGLAAWVGIERWQQSQMGPSTIPSEPAPTPETASSEAALDVATRYEQARLAGDVEGTCELAAQADTCRAGFGATPRSMELVSGPTAVKSEPVTIGAAQAVEPMRGTAVLVQFAIKGQDVRQVVIVVGQDGKVTKRVTVGSSNAGSSLQQIANED